MMIDTQVHSDLAVPPGEYLEEVIAEQGMSKAELAQRMGRPATKLSGMFSGKKSITPETALQLETVLGVPAHIWMGLETEYRLTLERNPAKEDLEELKREAALVTNFCYADLVKLKMVPDTRKPKERVRGLREFFGVMSLHEVVKMERYAAEFRCGRNTKRTPEALAAWLRYGERCANATQVRRFDQNQLRNLLPDLRDMTRHDPKVFGLRLVNALADCGVVFVLCPHFPKTGAHGATFPIGNEKEVLMMTIRGKWADVFWFSLFHEIGHILLHDRKSVIVEDGRDDTREDEADRFAADSLISPKDYRVFVKAGRFYDKDIRAFAKQVGIHPGIVVGRLQHDGHLRQDWQNGLRGKFEWAKDKA